MSNVSDFIDEQTDVPDDEMDELIDRIRIMVLSMKAEDVAAFVGRPWGRKDRDAVLLHAKVRGHA